MDFLSSFWLLAFSLGWNFRCKFWPVFFMWQHKQVVQRIKAVPNETKLLVMDEKTDQFYKSRNIVVTGSMPNVLYKQTPVPRPNVTTVVLTPTNNETVNHAGSTHSEEDRPSRMSDSYHSGSGSSSPVSSHPIFYPLPRHQFPHLCPPLRMLDIVSFVS